MGVITSQVRATPFNLCHETGDLIDKNQEGLTYSLGEVFDRSLTDKLKDWVKILRYATFYVGYFNPEALAVARLFGSSMGEFKNFLSIKELHKKTRGVYNSLDELLTKRTSRAAGAVFVASTGLMNSFLDGANFASRFVPLNSPVLQCMGRISPLAKTVSALINASTDYKTFNKATKAIDVELQILSLIKLSMDVAYIALGILFVGFPVVGLAPSFFATTTWSALATTLSLSAYFYDKMYDPTHKNSDVNWDGFKERVQFESQATG